MSNLASPDFQRAFAAVSYLVGQREAGLLAPFAAPHEEASSFARRLSHPERERRAEVLARELSRLALALEARLVK